MNDVPASTDLLSQLDGLNEQQLRRLLVEQLTRQKLGLYWEASAIERDRALNADVVLPRLVAAWSHTPAVRGEPVEPQATAHRNLILEGDNCDALRLLRASHRGKIRVIYIDPPYNTGNKDWVYNDRYVGANDRWRHSQWLEFLYRRLTLARDLLFWVGRPVGFGRPQFKRYKADLRNPTQPLSSWVVPSFEEGGYEAEASFVSSTNQEGARMVAEIFGDRAFNYAKPLSLIKNLLRQATRPGDTILDFFAGSGTTGQAVLELNAEDASAGSAGSTSSPQAGSAQLGQRRFILCSSTEATKKEPEKNLCCDVCAERMRRTRIKRWISTMLFSCWP